ncbi:MAG TPA: MarC family protein [Beijerinckiaceae bacterium]|jgi:multiple antibiotic resistance protein|nr:MarC family protein [Beijerinckiaceae bacterium]
MIRDFTASALATLLVTLDPPGLAPIFLALTEGMADGERRQVALRACLIAFAILTFFALGGGEILRLLGIGLPAFRIAGGMLLFWIAFEMVFQARGERKAQAAQSAVTIDRIRNVAAFPLAMPLLAGPGAITAAILLAGRAGSDPRLLAILIALVGAVLACCALVFLLAQRFARLLGVTGNIVLTRLLGVILAALAVQFIIDGTVAALELSRQT